jgi:PAS domain S-box-containing protein
LDGTPHIAAAINRWGRLMDLTERERLDRELQELNQRLAQDLQARIQTEKMLRSTANYLDVYHKIVDHHAIVAETDLAGNIVHANDAFCRISGYTREELIGKNHRILNSGVHPKSVWHEMFRQVVTKGVWHGEVCNRSKSGDLFWVDTTVVPLLNDVGKIKGYFAIRTDITGLKKAQAEAEAANIAKSEFLANMSHEIRTPITAILGFADLIADDSVRQDAERLDEFIRTIKRNGEHLLSIINDILDLSKIEAKKLVLEKLCANTRGVVDDVIELMLIKANGKGLQLRAQIDGNVPVFIHTDPTRLRQILINLVGNAIKFTELGSVSVRVRVDRGDVDRLIFEVTDTGIGMTEEQKLRIFQAFEQADASMTRKFGGTGLGLRISERLATMLGGQIEVHSELNVGSTFTLTIRAPACKGEGYAATGQQKADCPQPSMTFSVNGGRDGKAREESFETLKGVRILLIEDGPDNQRLVSFLLKKAGAVVTVADNGYAGIELLSIDGRFDNQLLPEAPFDVILMDMQMPVMDGYEATRALRSKGWTGPILSLTAHAMSHDLERCLAVGCDAHLTKPIDRNELVAACLRWSQSQARFNPHAERSPESA